MANLKVTVTLSTPLPVAVRDLPKLEKMARASAVAHGADHSTATMTQIGEDLVIRYEVNAR